ncbi:DsbA family protein [Candidatus Berkiella aquae]|uniref:Thiol:disulfide interchange protein DsbA n=1 Tax=Candidatus Berkiella aquae TaxID=295108 RepID=A0A0Q9YMZ1_9GAMM|nr:thiol:disulfide interchange protein DsbA/DsbL [Candidatus Berkiella aquae]MCS5712733.1 thiol:disulfide interchange protein DsbA/DsbL [Candidatus Berkiella aquae]
MNRMTIVFIALMTFWIPMNAVADLLVAEGQQYQRAPQEIAENTLVTELGKQYSTPIVVIEFFSYGCVGCFKLDPLIEAWRSKLPANVSFLRIPVEFHAEWRNLTKAYYTALNLNAFDKIHVQLFDAIHSNKLTSASDDAIREFFTNHGVDGKDFEKEFDSFNTNRKQKWAKSVTRAYRITAIPAFIVQGPQGIFVTTARAAGSQENIITVLDHLIKLELGETAEVAQVPAPDSSVPATPESSTPPKKED